MKPLVSVIMPAYNGEKYIKEAIESVLSQTYERFELIIVEDASTDETLSIIKEFNDERILLFQNSVNKGIAYSTNLGIDNSKGKYIALLDDDDIATPQRLELQAEFMEKHDEIDILGGRSAFVDKDGEFLRYFTEPIYNPKCIKAYLLFYNRKFANGTAMIRKSFIEKYNLRYQDNCYGMQDFKFYIDSSKVGMITSIDRLLHFKRCHDEEETTRQLKIHGKERAELYAQFQRESIEKSGFHLSEEDFRVINECVGPNRKPYYTKDDMKRLYDVFAEMIKQAKLMEIDYLPELEYVCKKILGDKILSKVNIFG